MSVGVASRGLVTEPIDTSTELGLAVVRVLVTFAGLESATKSLRLKAAYREQALRGQPHPTGRRAFGYTQDWSAVVPEEAALVREAAERVLAGETMAALARDWTLRGLRTPRGALWSVHRVRDMLLSPRFWGMRSYHGEAVAEGTWPAILDPETGARLRYLLAHPSRRREPPQGRPSLLTGLLRCGRCGSRMVTRRSQRGAMTYCCNSAPRGCSGVSARQAGVDAVVEAAAIRELGRRRDAIPERAGQDQTLVAAAVERHARALNEAADDFYVKNIIDRTVFLSVRDGLDRSLYEETSGGTAVPMPARFVRLLEDPGRQWPSLTISEQRAALQVVLDHVVIHPAPRSSGRFRPERVEVVFPGQRVERAPDAVSTTMIGAEALLTTAEVGRCIDLCVVTVERMIRRGELPATKEGNHWMILGADVQRCKGLRDRAGVRRVRRSSQKFAQILREYNAARAAPQFPQTPPT